VDCIPALRASNAQPESSGPPRPVLQPFKYGTWSLGEAFDDIEKVRAGQDSLVRSLPAAVELIVLVGPYMLESYECPLPIINPTEDIFDANEECTASTEIRRLKELQINDRVESSDDLESLESDQEVPDEAIESRQEQSEKIPNLARTNRKRKEAIGRNNFVKLNMRRRKRVFPTERPKRSNDKSHT